MFLFGLIVGSWITKPRRDYPTGEHMRSLGVREKPDATLDWAARSREKIVDFAKRNKIDLAHFNGSLVLTRTGSPFDGADLQLLDGRLANHARGLEGDDLIAADLRELKRGTLETMLSRTKNDWRIRIFKGRIIEPEGPFSGCVTLDGSGNPLIGTYVEIEVDSDRVVSVRRRFETFPID
jgi:hypothetical protein